MDFSRSHTNNRRSATRGSLAWRFPVLVLVALAGLGATATASADNPGYDRPGYGFTPSVLTAGEVTLEQGLPDWSRDRQDGVRSVQYNADTLLRIGVGGALELQLATSPWNTSRQTDASHSERDSGHGDSALGMKLALPSTNPAFSWGLLGSVEFTDGSPAFRSEHRHYLLGAQFNLQASARHSLGVYLQDVRDGDTENTTLAISDNVALSSTLTLYLEAAALHVPVRGNGTLSGVGLAWLLSPRVQLDAGLDHRLAGAAPEWQTNLGVSIYFGR